MYVARKELKVMKNGKPFFYKPGDEIPDFEAWDIHAHRAHLNLEWVEQVEEAPVKASAKPIKKEAVKVVSHKKPLVKPKAKPKKTDKKKAHATE